MVGGLTVVGAAWAATGSPVGPAVSTAATSSAARSTVATAVSTSATPTDAGPTAAPGTVVSEAPVQADPTAAPGPVESVAPEEAGPMSWSGPVDSALPDPGEPTDVEGSGEWIDIYEPVDLSGQLIVHTRAGATVTPTDEGAVIVTSEPRTVTVPTAWTLLPVGDRFQLATVAPTDGRPTCLSVSGPGAVGLELCDAGRDGQLLQLAVSPTTSAGAPVEIRSESGYLAVNDRGALTVDDRGPFTRTTG